MIFSKFKKLTFLGTSSAIPLPLQRQCSSIIFGLSNGKHLLFDCAEGTQSQIILCKSFKISKISHIFISHLHGDHFYGIFGVVNSFSMFNVKQNKIETLNIIGPVGIKKIMLAIFEATGFYKEDNKFIKIHELDFKQKEIDLTHIVKTVKVKAIPIQHTVPTFAFIVEEDKSVCLKFDPEKAINCGIPNSSKHFFKKLSDGFPVEINSDSIVYPEQVLTKFREPYKVTIMSDTNDGTNAIEAAHNSDILIHESTWGKEAPPEKIKEFMHSTSEMAGAFAKKVAAKKLILTHFSGRYKNNESTENSLENLKRQAREFCPDCNVFIAKDFMNVDFNKNGVKINRKTEVHPKHLKNLTYFK